ncbi:MAG: bifunctional glutamate N-acetyltransferase/amino-acid acetyltransferase ArgJ [Candidatus Omnitrophica bacterium]|nr:bifunctional glutamate N-acetyltransferase/amino-acid acetyltransferase ArgJ [Candidatus Omnitrophota bacterium]
MAEHKLPKGFLANGINCGVKRKRKDLALIYSEQMCRVAAVFTNNVVKAAPVVLARQRLKKNPQVRAIVINSGNANCMTGRQGIRDAREICSRMAGLIGAEDKQVLSSSTGIIGQTMDMDPIIKGMPVLIEGLSRKGLFAAAEGIMTTDITSKVSSSKFSSGGKTVRITGIAKGAGMIDPSMATMLCYIMTDANISRQALKKALLHSNETSFNAITVDGDMSTNDTVMVLSNAEAGNPLIGTRGKDYRLFREHLEKVCRDLAQMVVRDGEGASKFIEVNVAGAKSKKDAKKVADAIAGSLLVKCAVLGGDPNWGRIASSAGSCGVKFDPDRIEIALDGVTFFKNGKAVVQVNRRSSSVFKGKNVRIDVNLHAGRGEATVYSCDISKKYITLNSFYTT